MEILLLLIPLGIAVVAFAGAALVWALYSGQYDALDRIGRQMPDDEPDWCAGLTPVNAPAAVKADDRPLHMEFEMRPSPQSRAVPISTASIGETRALLQARREELDERLQRIERDRRRLTQPLPQDFADQAIVRENDEVVDRLAEATAADLAQVIRAQARLERGLHGQCEHCGATIDPERLHARPEATLCCVCAEASASAG